MNLTKLTLSFRRTSESCQTVLNSCLCNSTTRLSITKTKYSLWKAIRAYHWYATWISNTARFTYQVFIFVYNIINETISIFLLLWYIFDVQWIITRCIAQLLRIRIVELSHCRLTVLRLPGKCARETVLHIGINRFENKIEKKKNGRIIYVRNNRIKKKIERFEQFRNRKHIQLQLLIYRVIDARLNIWYKRVRPKR